MKGLTGALIVMGVTGSGKSTLGQALAGALDCAFVEGDTLHPPANIAKMSAGLPLNDADRIPFLKNVAQILASRKGPLVISCSALKRAYRDRLRRADPQLIFVYPLLSHEQLRARLEQRSGHFMPAALLDSQLADLEPPGPGERCIQVDGGASPANQVASVRAALAERQS